LGCLKLHTEQNFANLKVVYGGKFFDGKNCAGSNKYKYNGIEHNNDLDLNMYDARYRNLDPQIGRFWQLDPKPNKSISMYAAMENNPVRFSDPLGDTARIQFRTGFLGLGKKQEVVYNNGNLTNKDGSAYTGKVKGYLGKVVGALGALNNTAEGRSMVSELQNSTNNFTIKNGSSNSFTPSNQTASFGNIPSLQNVSNGTLPTGGSGGTIVWNPNISTSGMNTAGSTDRPAYIGLGHEMAHGRDANQGLLYIGSDYTNPLNGNSYLAQDQGLNKSEWRAVYFENIIRGQAGLPLRSQYGLQDNGGTFTGTGPSLLTPAGLPINFPIQ
jgi:RHS repeat-associated protein